jgi:hypothetical protein
MIVVGGMGTNNRYLDGSSVMGCVWDIGPLVSVRCVQFRFEGSFEQHFHARGFDVEPQIRLINNCDNR